MEEEHRCLELCGRELKCGKHFCDQLCHKGPCPSCLEAVFDEIACACKRTVLQPPQPCGTRPPECRFDCLKPTACGHPPVRHNCHPEIVRCPKCPFLVERPCVCGKKTLKNQPCWFEEPHCGTPCGKKLKCGVHECGKTCHRPGDCEDAGISGSHCTQPCRKAKRSCEHYCAEQCHAPYACKEDKPCQDKAIVTCECQNRKQEVKCLATKTNPWPVREPLKCDDECLRLQRNRRLADALNIDPDTHMDSHIPYSDTTLRFYRDNVGWAQTQEREFRVFASDADEKRLRFKPMASAQRAFLHSLAEDFGLDSQSQDPEGIRHVTLFKTPRFVSAPTKTLAQCLSIIRSTAPVKAVPIARVEPSDQQNVFNAYLLQNPRFGLTIDEVDSELEKVFSAPRAASLAFTTSFLPSEQVLISASPKATTAAAATATWRSLTPQAVESLLKALKGAVNDAVTGAGLAASTSLCRADAAGNILRREGEGDPGSTGAGAWSTVAAKRTRLAGRLPGSGAAAAAEQPAPRSFVALKKGPPARQKQKEIAELLAAEPVEEDWLAAAEKDDGEQEASVGQALLGIKDEPADQAPSGQEDAATGRALSGEADKVAAAAVTVSAAE